jgi:uncharacterized membrane protein HdeD (DUF308 family)
MTSSNNNWGLFLIRGILALILGVLTLLAPGITFTLLVIYIGAYMLVSGVLSVVRAFKVRKASATWGWFLVYGIVAIIAGCLTLYNPFVGAASLIYLIAAWALVTGVMEIIAAISLRKMIRGEGWYILAGIINILLAIFFVLNPLAGAITVAVVFGVYALLIGIMFIILSIRLKRMDTTVALSPGF